jgi:hypothetical protein
MVYDVQNLWVPLPRKDVYSGLEMGEVSIGANSFTRGW